jgi:hypothetical protein
MGSTYGRMDSLTRLDNDDCIRAISQQDERKHYDEET